MFMPQGCPSQQSVALLLPSADEHTMMWLHRTHTHTHSAIHSWPYLVGWRITEANTCWGRLINNVVSWVLQAYPTARKEEVWQYRGLMLCCCHPVRVGINFPNLCIINRTFKYDLNASLNEVYAGCVSSTCLTFGTNKSETLLNRSVRPK